MSKKYLTIDVYRRAAKLCGYKTDYIDKPYSNAIFVTNGDKQFIAHAKKSSYGLYPLNSKFAETLADDKSATKRVLKKYGFRTIKGKRFYIFSDTKIKPTDTVSAALDYAAKLRFPVFVKPNTALQGTNARIIFTKSSLRDHIRKMRSDAVDSFLVEEFLEYPEYRIFIVGGKVQFVYKKKRISVIGTGKHTIRELISRSRDVIDEEVMKKMLKSKKHREDHILPEEAELILQETANISTGAKIVEYQDVIPKKLNDWAHEIYRVTGLDVCGIDVFTADNWDQPEGYKIIEVNSNPGLGGIYNAGYKEKAIEICSLIMKRFFARRIIR